MLKRIFSIADPHPERHPMLDIRQTAAPETETTVVCRPTGSLRAALWSAISLQPLMAFCFFLAATFAAGVSWSALGLGVLGSSFFAPFTLWGAVYLSRACVIADPEGLRWRYTGRWHKAAWAEVVSCSDDWRIVKPQTEELFVKIQTLKGTILAAPEQWTSTAELREYVQQNATATERSGRFVTGGTATYFPLNCRYDTLINRNILGWMEKVHWYGLLAVVVYFALQWFTTRTLPGWGWLLTPTGLFVIAKQTLPFLLRPTYQATRTRLGDKVYADKEGLRFITGGNETEVAWDDITDLYSVGIRSVVVAQDKNEYDFLDTLTDAERLKLVIPRLAVNAGHRGWRTGIVHRQEIVSSDGRQSVQCIYRYRSQESCGKLCSLTLAAFFIVAIAAGPALIAWQGGIVPSSRELALALGGVLGLLALFWLWGNYFRGALRTNEEGIAQQTLFGKRFLPWSQVRAFRWQGSQDLTWGCVEGMSGTIKFWKGIGDADRLADEIAAQGIIV